MLDFLLFPVLVLELDLGYDCFVPDLYKLRQHTGFTKFKLLKMLILEQNTMLMGLVTQKC